MIWDIAALILGSILFTVLVGNGLWRIYKERKEMRQKELIDEKIFEEDLMRMYGARCNCKGQCKGKNKEGE